MMVYRNVHVYVHTYCSCDNISNQPTMTVQRDSVRKCCRKLAVTRFLGLSVFFWWGNIPLEYHCEQKYLQYTGRGSFPAWPWRSPDLRPMDLFFWDYMKNICEKKTAGLRILWHRITEATTTMTEDMIVNCDVRSNIILTCVKQLMVLTLKTTRGQFMLLNREITSSLLLYNKYFSVYEFSFPHHTQTLCKN
jgi:hypothetical protein